MGISLQGTDAWAVDDRLQPGSYIARPALVERTSSSGGNPQVLIDWRIAAGSFQGAQQKDWITVTDAAMGRVVQLLDACDIAIPETDFESHDAVADWLAETLRQKLPPVEMVVRNEPSRKDPSKEWPTVKGYRRPGPGSDIPGDASGFAAGPNVSNADDDKPLPF